MYTIYDVACLIINVKLKAILSKSSLAEHYKILSTCL